MGRRSSKNVGGSTTFIYNGQNLIAERGTLIADFIFGPTIDEPLAMRRSGTTYYFIVDALGSVSLLNDSNGTILDKYVFDAWGVTRSQTAPISNPFGYTSREFAEAGALYFRARFLQTSIGRFNAPDMLGWKVGVNLYLYVKNDPVNFIDPSGLKLCKLNAPTPNGQDTIIVDESIATQIESLISSADEAGISLQITKAFRTSEEQARLYNSNNPYPVAVPGSSNHEAGTAIDFNTKNLSKRQLLELESIAISLGLRHPSNDKVHLDNSLTLTRDFYNFQDLYLENQKQFLNLDPRNAIDWCNIRCSIEPEPIFQME